MVSLLFGYLKYFLVKILALVLLSIELLQQAILHRMSEGDVRHCVALLLRQFEHVVNHFDVIHHARALHL